MPESVNDLQTNPLLALVNRQCDQSAPPKTVEQKSEIVSCEMMRARKRVGGITDLLNVTELLLCAR
jgi:hypothetical protein